MIFSELNPTIQSWIDSDEFIDSLVSIMGEFGLLSSAPLSESVINLALKAVKPEEFKAKLLASLPPDKQNEAIVSKLVNFSLLPIKGPLAESGIDISIIAPLDEANASPYNPASSDNEASDELPVGTGPISPVSPIESQPAQVIDDSIPLSPNFSADTAPLASPLPDKPANGQAPAPFVIHEEKTVPQASMNSHKESPIRPMFYSGEPETRGTSPVVNIEFGKSESENKVGPENVVDLKDLPL
jgi:hypothetical protein